ncbi:hypothetical protein PGB90_009994 [Kerria lacca]
MPSGIKIATIQQILNLFNFLIIQATVNRKVMGSDNKVRQFNHPFVQTCVMFIGEILCLLAFKILFSYYSRRQVTIQDINVIRGNQNFNSFIFLPPAIFDIVATSLMYIGLEMTYVSSFQMLRGSVIVFVALLSQNFIGRTIKIHQWGGILFIILGLVVVGWSDFKFKEKSVDTNTIITGDLLIIIAQIITACQIVYEEKFLLEKDIPPLQAVGWEGIFGFVILSILLFPFYYIHVGYPFENNPREVLEDLPDAITQMINNKLILVSLLGTMISIAFFNFAGTSMTKEISATTRMVLDTVRTFFIWIYSIIFSWQAFEYPQLFGFLILLVGMVIYYNIIPIRHFHFYQYGELTPEEPIINQKADET